MLKIYTMSRHFVAYGCKKPLTRGFCMPADFLIDTCDIPPPTGRISPAKVSGRYSMPPLLVAEAVLLEAVAGATIVARPAPATADAKDTVAAVPSRAWSCKEFHYYCSWRSLLGNTSRYARLDLYPSASVWLKRARISPWTELEGVRHVGTDIVRHVEPRLAPREWLRTIDVEVVAGQMGNRYQCTALLF